MKPWKKLVTAILAIAMCVSTSACGNSESSSSQGTAGADSSQTQEGNNEDLEYDQVVYALWTGNKVPDDCSDVEEAINQITRNEIGVEVTIRPIAAAEYANKVGLAYGQRRTVGYFQCFKESEYLCF